MIADVTGFTPLTERALTSKRGTELVEELTVCMNNYFNEAIDMVFDYGGDIIKVRLRDIRYKIQALRCMT